MADAVLAYNEAAYRASGAGAQRRYPNEEFCRYMGRNFFHVPRGLRRGLRFLEIGSGTGANLWAVAREGFHAHGIDLSPSAEPLAREMLAAYGTVANLQTGDMRKLPYPSAHFASVADVFSTYCVDAAGFRATLAEVARVLEPGGRFFCYTPGKRSQAWTDPGPARRIDASTLSGIERPTSPYYPAPHPFRFVSAQELRGELEAAGLRVARLELVTRTYGDCSELFEFVVAEAKRPVI